MKRCDYCGKENEEHLRCCTGCGTVLAESFPAANPGEIPPVIQELSLPAAAGPLGSLNASRATMILAAFLMAQVAGGLVVGMIGGMVAGIRGEKLHEAGQREKLTRKIT